MKKGKSLRVESYEKQLEAIIRLLFVIIVDSDLDSERGQGWVSGFVPRS